MQIRNTMEKIMDAKKVVSFTENNPFAYRYADGYVSIAIAVLIGLVFFVLN